MVFVDSERVEEMEFVSALQERVVHIYIVLINLD